MDDKGLREQPTDEIARLSHRIEELEALEAKSRQTEKALRESERRYRKLIENITDTIFTVDADWNFTFISPKFERITGHRVQDLIWHPFFEILAPECIAAARERLMKTAPEEANLPYETDFLHKDGSRIHIELCIMPILDGNGHPTGVTLAAVRDLTGHKQILEETVKTQKLESIGVLAGGIAHDFNNVLTGILGNISLAKVYLESESATDKAIGRLIEAEEASIQAKSLTQRILTFARGGAPIKKAIHIGGLIRNSASLALSGSNVKCEFLIPDDLWQVEADEGQINQVISNIIINAVQAMPEGGIVRAIAENLNVSSKQSLPVKAGPYVKISIQDHGVGIPKENLPKIFDPYFTTKQKRSGLGLATAFSIIKRHEGHITAESQMGVGTTLHVYLPASPEKTAEKKDAKKEAKLEAKPVIMEQPVTGKGKVLIMDDEELIRDLLSEMLTNIGYEVALAISGTETIGIYKEAKQSGKPFDAVIIDLTIPGGMGGKETIQRLREIDPDVKAIVSSGYSNDPIMAEFERYGFKGVIAKPYKIHELSDVLHKVITE